MSEQDLLNTPLNSPNAKMDIPAPTVSLPEAPQAAPAPNYFEDALAVQQGNYVSPDLVVEPPMTKAELIADKTVEKQERLQQRTPYDPLVKLEEYDEVTKHRILNGRDSAVSMSVDSAQKMIGAGVRTVGSFMGEDSVESWGQSVIDQQVRDIELGGYESEYGGQSLRETFETQGMGNTVGRLWEMMGENVATSGVALVGGLAAAATAPFSVPAAMLVAGGTTLLAGSMGVGESALEMEDKGVEINELKAIGVGILISVLDRFGAGKVIPKSLLSRMTGDQIVDRLVKKGFIDAAKGVSKTILGKAAWESGTEVLQETAIIGAAATQGAQYTKEEVVDRFIDVAFVAAGMGGTTATASGTLEYAQAVKKSGGETAIVQSIKKTAGEALTKVRESRLDERSSPDSPVYQAVKYSQDTADKISGTPAEAKEYVETLSDMVDAATIHMEENPGTVSEALLNDFKKLQDIQTKVIDDVNVRQELGENIDQQQLAIDIEEIVKKGMVAALSPESREKLKGGVLYSMKTDDIVTEEQAKAFINEFKPQGAEREVATNYLKRLKSMKEVGSDVLSGEGNLFVGAKTHARTIQAALLSGDTEAATKHLAKFTQFAEYMRVKAGTFNAVWQHNRDIASKKTEQKIPAGINIISQDESGRITEFTLTDVAKYGMNVDGVGKVWDSAKDGQIRSLANQITKENKVIASYLAQTTAAVNGTGTTTESATTQSTTEEEYLSGSVPTAPAPLSQEEIDSMDDGSTSQDSVEEVAQVTDEDISKATEAPTEAPVVEAVVQETTTPIVEEVAIEPTEAAPVSINSLGKEAITLNNVIEGMKKSQKTAKDPSTYDARIAALEAELQVIIDKAAAKEAARLADPKTALEVYDLSKSILTDTEIDLDYLNDIYQESVEAEYVQSTIWPTGEEEAREAGRTMDSVLEPKSSKEIQSEEEIKDTLESRNLFKTVRNFFKAFKKNAAFLKMNKAELSTVSTLADFNSKFTAASIHIIAGLSNNLDKDNMSTVHKEGTDRFQENPMNYLLKMISVNGVFTGYLDPNILSIMAMSGMDYLATMGTSTIYNDDAAVKALVGLDSNEQVSSSALQPFRRVGTTKAAMADIIGAMIFKQLGLKGTAIADETLEAQMITALGLTTIDIMGKMGLLTQSSKPRNELDILNPDAPVVPELVNFVRVAVTKKEGKDVVIDSVRSYVDNYSLKNGSQEAALSTILDSLFGITSNKKFPSLKPRKVRKGATYLRSDVKIPAKVIKDIEYAQSVEWRFKPAIAALLGGTDREATIQALKDISGFKSDLSEVATYFMEKAIADNDTILREITDTLTFFDMMALSGQDQFHYSYNSWNNSRHGMAESAVSPQSSKLIRHLIFPTDPITGESFSEELSMNDPVHMQMFKVAIAQTLLSKVAIDKDTLATVNDEFEKVIGTGKPIRRNPIANAGREVRDGANPVTVAAKYGLADTISVDGLVALGEYYKALKGKSDKFTVNIAIETDATTSGLIISFLNTGLRSEGALKKLAAGGVYTDRTSYVEHNQVNPDNYEMLANVWADKIKLSDAFIEGHAEDVIALLGMPSRADAKDPVLQHNYFAGVKTLVSGYVEASLDKLYEGLTSPDAAVRKIALDHVNNIMAFDNKLLNKPKSFKQAKVVDNGIHTVLTKWQQIKFQVVVRAVYGQAMEDGLAELGNEFAVYGESLNEAGNTAYHVFKTLQDSLEKGLMEARKQDFMSNEMREIINNDPTLTALYPRMKFFDTGDGAGIHAFKKNNERNTDAGSRVVTRYPDGRPFNGKKSTSARTSTVNDSAPGVSLVARSIQGMDDVSARSVFGQYPVMHLFDAVFSTVLNTVRNTKEYNTATLEANRDFSIFDNAVALLQNIVDTLDKNPTAAAIVATQVLDSESPLFEMDFKAMLKAALKTQKKIQGDKAVLFGEDIVHVDHAGLENTGIINEGNINEEVTEAGLDALVEAFLGQPLGADAASQIDHTNFVHSDSETLSSENALDIFDTLGVADRQGNSTDTAEHVTHLRTLLADIIAPALSKLGDFSLRMRRAGDTNAGSIQDNEILLNFGVNNGSNVLLNQGSERTTYVHELVHAITRFMFDDPKLSNTAAEIVKLRERARKHLNEKYKGEPWKAFLSQDESIAGHVYDKDAEIAHAKSTYEYVFEQKGTFYTAGNSNKASARGIHEFVTYGLTDPRLKAELASMSYKSKRDAATTIGGRIQNAFLELIDRIIGRVKHRGTNADSALIQLVAALNKVDTKTRFNTNFIMKGIGRVDDISALKITKWVFTPIAKMALAAQNVRSNTILGKSVHVAAGVVGAVNPVQELPVGDTGAIMKLPFREALDESRKRLRISKNSLLMYILRTIAGPSNDMDRKVEHMLAKSKMVIDQSRKNIIEGTRKHLEESFRTPMEKQDWEALTLSVLKTDLISLFPNLTAEEIPKFADILRNTKGVRKNKIAKVRAKLAAYGVIGDHYIQQSKGLGLFMAKGEVTVRMQRLNAYMIANSKGVVQPKDMPKDLAAVEALVETLASLYAIDSTDGNVNARTADIFERETKANANKNGVTEFLGLAVSAKQDALAKNFNNDKTHTIKGHIKSITNPNISVKVALLSEKKKMREMGYKLVAALQDDTVSDPSKDNKALYSSDFVTMQDYNRGIISTTSMRASGTLLSQMLANSTVETYNYASSKKAVKAAVTSNNREARKNMRNPDHAITDSSVMVPVFDTNQNIVDFRYMMTDHTKLSVLKQELRSNVVLSALVGSISDKAKTTVMNEEALVLMKEDFDANFLKKSDEFIKIGLNSGKAKHRELYNMLPEETKMLIKKVFGANELHIDEKYIDILFGQRSLSIADLPFMNHRIVKIAEVIWKEMVSMAKKNIVIKTGSVLYHNILSNTVVGILNGVPIEFMIKEQLRTARDLNAYMSVKRDLYATKAELKAAISLNDTKGISEAQDTIKSFESVLHNSPVRELIRRGMFQSITEEIDTESDPYSYASALSEKINKFAGKNKTLSKVNAGAQAVGRYTYMTDDTSMYKLLLKTTQYSDFVARQAVFKYKTEVVGMTKDETENLVRDLFVNYDLPDHQIIQYMNDTGISMFTKYPMRMLRVIFKMMKGRPVEGIMLILLEDFMGFNIDDPTDMGLNILNSPFGIVEDAFTQSGVEMARNVF